MNYKTANVVKNLKLQQGMDRFLIEAMKLNTDIRFQEKYDGMKIYFDYGDTLMLKDIAAAATDCVPSDTGQLDADIIQKQTFEKCAKVSHL